MQAHPPRVLQQLIVRNLVEHGRCGSAGYGIAAIRIEVAEGSAERCHRVLTGKNSACRIAIGHGLAHGDRIRDYAVPLMGPHVRADPAEAGLDLVGDQQASGSPDCICCRLEPSIRQVREALIDEQGANDQCRKAVRTVREPLSLLGNRVGEGPGMRHAGFAAQGTIAVRRGDKPYVAVTGKRGVIATDYTYHGNTAAVAQLSRSNVPQTGVGDHIGFVPAPDSYRPLGGEPGMAHARAFADEVAEQALRLKEGPHGFAALVVCPLFVNEGFPDLPDGWLKPAADAVRAAGGLLIADEVQAGFGRIGTHMWTHQRHGIVPDAVTMGKPMANGYPAGAVFASQDTMAAFRRSFRYFNTYGGNPVACAAATAVLDELEDKKLLDNARRVGLHARLRLKELASKHEAIGDTRGLGLVFGAEMVKDRVSKEPAGAYADRVANAMRDRGIIISTSGRGRNILKIRPPMPFSIENADMLFESLDEVLRTLGLEP